MASGTGTKISTNGTKMSANSSKEGDAKGQALEPRHFRKQF